MARLGRDKKTIHSVAATKQVAHQHVPGKAFNISDPVTRLINIIGGTMFNEPSYYSSGAVHQNLAERLKTATPGMEVIGLNENAMAVIAAAVEVASVSPEELLIIARWARDPKYGLKLRTTPQVLLAVAAHCEGTKPFVRQYTPLITLRADDILQAFAAYRHLFQGSASGKAKGSLPHSLRKGLAAALQRFKEYDFLKWDGANPSFKDVLLMDLRPRGSSRGTRKIENPVSKEIFEYLVNGKVVDPDKTPMFAARQRLTATTDWSQVTPELLQSAGATWENIISKFGSTTATWEAVIPLMGEFALVRNLRNFEAASISRQAWDAIYQKIATRVDTKLLPFRYYAAFNEVKSTHAQSVLGRAIDNACMNLPELKGQSAIFADNSGSCQSQEISSKSKMKVSDCGNMLMAVMAKRFGRNAMIGVFGDCYKEIPFIETDTCLRIKEQIEHFATKADPVAEKYLSIPGVFRVGRGVGLMTETGLWWALHDITQREIKVDRIILLSDLCCYTQGDVNCGIQMSQYFGADASIESMVEKYRQLVNPDVFVYSINLAGYSQAQTSLDNKRNVLLSGWSESIIRTMSQIEGSANQTQEVLPVIGALRERYAASELFLCNNI